MSTETDQIESSLKSLTEEVKKNAVETKDNIREESLASKNNSFSITKSLSEYFEKQKDKEEKVEEAIEENVEETSNVARKVEDSNAILQSSIAVQNAILAKMTEMNSSLERMFTQLPEWIKQSQHGAGGGGLGSLAEILGSAGLLSLLKGRGETAEAKTLGAAEVAATELGSSLSTTTGINNAAADAIIAKNLAHAAPAEKSLLGRMASKVGGAGAAVGTGVKKAAGLGWKALPFLGDIYQGYSDYQESGSLGEAAFAAGGSLVGRLGGAAAGTFVGGPIGTAVGEVGGSLVGSEAAIHAYKAMTSSSTSTPTGTNTSPDVPKPVEQAPPSIANTQQPAVMFNPTTGQSSVSSINTSDLGGVKYSGGIVNSSGVTTNTGRAIYDPSKEYRMTSEGLQPVGSAAAGHVGGLGSLLRNVESPFSSMVNRLSLGHMGGSAGSDSQGEGMGNHMGASSPSGGGSSYHDSGGSTKAHGNLSKNQQEAYNSAIKEGLSPSAAKILVANMSGESLRDPTNNHWDVSHMSQGIVQWDPKRAEDIKKQFGAYPKDMSVADQTKAAIWEMKTHPEYSKAWSALNNEKMADSERMYGVVKNYERPADAGGAASQRMKFLRGLEVNESNKENQNNEIKGLPADTPTDITRHLVEMKRAGKVTNDECVSLAKASVNASQSVTDWRRGDSAQAGNLVPGTPVSTFMDGQGRQSNRYAGGGTGSHGGNDHAAIFEHYNRDKAGNITGIHVAEQYVGSHGVREQDYAFNHGRGIHDGSNYAAIKDSHGDYLGGGSNPMTRVDKAPVRQPPPEPHQSAPLMRPRDEPQERMASGGHYGSRGHVRGNERIRNASATPSWGDMVRTTTGTYGVA